MPGRTPLVLLPLLLAAVVVLFVHQQAGFSAVDGALMAITSEEGEVERYESSYTDADGVTHKVVTVCREDETEDECLERHAQRVAKMKEKFPPGKPDAK